MRPTEIWIGLALAIGRARGTYCLLLVDWATWLTCWLFDSCRVLELIKTHFFSCFLLFSVTHELVTLNSLTVILQLLFYVWFFSLNSNRYIYRYETKPSFSVSKKIKCLSLFGVASVVLSTISRPTSICCVDNFETSHLRLKKAYRRRHNTWGRDV